MSKSVNSQSSSKHITAKQGEWLSKSKQRVKNPRKLDVKVARISSLSTIKKNNRQKSILSFTKKNTCSTPVSAQGFYSKIEEKENINFTGKDFSTCKESKSEIDFCEGNLFKSLNHSNNITPSPTESHNVLPCLCENRHVSEQSQTKYQTSCDYKLFKSVPMGNRTQYGVFKRDAKEFNNSSDSQDCSNRGELDKLSLISEVSVFNPLLTSTQAISYSQPCGDYLDQTPIFMESVVDMSPSSKLDLNAEESVFEPQVTSTQKSHAPKITHPSTVSQCLKMSTNLNLQDSHSEELTQRGPARMNAECSLLLNTSQTVDNEYDLSVRFTQDSQGKEIFCRLSPGKAKT